MSEPTSRLSRAGDPAQIRVYPDGPLVVRGDVEIVGPDGELVAQRRRMTALCRCGHSSLNPLCDGTHKQIRRFRPDTAGRDEALRDG